MSSPRPSWRPLLAATGALFLVILAFLAGQVKAGGDPAIGRGNVATQQVAPPSGDDGFIPGGTQPAPPVPDSSGSADAPTTHQS